MDDLYIPAGPDRPRGLVAPAGELAERLFHASGPGSQNVNTADSRVQLSLDPAAIVTLNDEQRECAPSVLGDHLTGTLLTITTAEHRSQCCNRATTCEHLAEVLRLAPVLSILRRATKSTRGSRLRRFADKKRRSEVKAYGRRPDAD